MSAMKEVRTKYCRGNIRSAGRIIATTDDPKRQFAILCDRGDNLQERHAKAAMMLVNKLGWYGELNGIECPDGTIVWTLISDDKA
jgi:hypothetical protein